MNKIKKDNVVLVGCGQHCNVVIYNIKAQGKYNIIGILDEDNNKIGTKLGDVPVIGNYNDVQFLNKIKKIYKVDKFFISFGNMKYRKKVYEFFINNEFQPINIIHPNAVVSKDAVLGKGILIECGCLITPNPKIGDNVVINTGSQVNHDNIVENHVYIASGVVLSGGVKIGENTLLDDGVVVTLGKSIGNNCVIGAGSVVTKNIDNNIVAYGNPCHTRRNNTFL